MIREASRRLIPGLLAFVISMYANCGPQIPAGDSRVSPGYVLFTPLLSTSTYLINERGQVVHIWRSRYPPGTSVALLENGHLLRSGREPDGTIRGPGQGGRIQEFTWEGDLVWDWVAASDQRMPHHDFQPLPNGNILLIVWERKGRDEALRAGRRPDAVGRAGLWPDSVLEVRPSGQRGGTVVWEWHSWDHLIQDRDSRAPGYGLVPDHPELIDINGNVEREPLTDEQVERFRALGYISGETASGDLDPDFMHTNAIAFHPQLNQIALSVTNFNELWIIDHGTTTAEASGHAGGRSGRGGDLLYRWGNARVYGRGRLPERYFYGLHDVRWIPPGYPGGGHLMAFNNGSGRRGADYSTVVEIEPPVRANGTYALEPGRPFAPSAPCWEYPAKGRSRIYADFLSSAHRLPNGNTFICLGPQGRFLEVTRR